MRRQHFANREQRKPKQKGKRMGSKYSTMMFDANGRVVPRDDSEVEIWLCLHGETPSGKAWVFSTTSHEVQSVCVPKKICEIRDTCGGFDRWSAGGTYKKTVPVHRVAMPAFMAMEKGLIPRQGARAA